MDFDAELPMPEELPMLEGPPSQTNSLPSLTPTGNGLPEAPLMDGNAEQ
jgi:hypothetical protein